MSTLKRSSHGDFNWTNSKKLKLRVVGPILIDKFSIRKDFTRESLLSDFFKATCKNKVSAKISSMENSTWQVNLNPRDGRTANDIDSIDVVFDEEIDFFSSIQEQLSALTHKVSDLESCIGVFSRPHILNLCKEILLFLDRGDVWEETENSNKFSNLPKLKACKIKTFAEHCGFPFDEFCSKANQLISTRNAMIHPPNFDTLQAMVNESKALFKQIPAIDRPNYAFEMSLMNNFSRIL